MYYYYVPQVYPYVNYYAAPYIRQQAEVYQQAQPSQERRPYLMTWPYSNSYYGNYYES